MAISRKQFLKNTSLASLALAGFSKTTCASDEAEQDHSLILPNSLSWNSTIGLVAPASPIYDPAEFDRMIVTLKSLGFTLKLGNHVTDRHGYLAGKDKDRATDLMEMFQDSSVDAIICIRGGWGCNRILDLLDYKLIRKNPKPLIGFSDITSLHNAILNKSGLVTFHGPVGKSDWNSFTKNSFEEVLISGKEAQYILPDNQPDAYKIYPGISQGSLKGGNLSVLVAMIGSEYLPDFKSSILYLEDVGEDVYRIDRMLTQLKLSGILDDITGFIFGKCTNCNAGSNSLSLKQVFKDHIEPLKIPAFYGAMISHDDKNITIPVGLKAEMNADNFSFKVLSRAVN
ncbi:MAG: LD-carboxypeptidase [Balneola sp.]